MGEVRVKKPSSTLNLKDNFRTTTNGRAGGLFARTGALSGHPSKQQSRSMLLHPVIENSITSATAFIIAIRAAVASGEEVSMYLGGCGCLQTSVGIVYGGGEGRRLGPLEAPLALQDECLRQLGYCDYSRRARLGIDPDLRHIVRFYVGPAAGEGEGRSGSVLVLKGLVLPQWRRRTVQVLGHKLFIHPGPGSSAGTEVVELGGAEVEAAKSTRCGRRVLRVSANRQLFLGFDSSWERQLWWSWLKQRKAYPRVTCKYNVYMEGPGKAMNGKQSMSVFSVNVPFSRQSNVGITLHHLVDNAARKRVTDGRLGQCARFAYGQRDRVIHRSDDTLRQCSGHSPFTLHLRLCRLAINTAADESLLPMHGSGFRPPQGLWFAVRVMNQTLCITGTVDLPEESLYGIQYMDEVQAAPGPVSCS
ncbi:PH domain leucine-rich repeat-containing protein phosphatase 2 [Homalodisca vitripennis]|nr:PH domain leucine-rich repeat-containing protein phosphatase 2 [Homalodisca vitripennis]